MKVISFNANGIRAAARKGFFQWLHHAHPDADVVCIQETKAQEEQLCDLVFHPDGYHAYFFDAQKKGYSGTAIYCKKQPDAVTRGLGWDHADNEGRYIQIDYAHISLASLYMPSGSSSEARQQVKFDFLERFYPYLKRWMQQTSKREFIISADWNICHQPIDLKNWRANQKNSGFLPEERAWLDRVYSEIGWQDSFRVLHPELAQYTWWSNRGQARANNVGWRLDYQLVTPKLATSVRRAEVFTDTFFSDHAPLIMTYDYKL